MNLEDAIQIEGFQAGLTVSRHEFTSPTGLGFRGLLEVIPHVDPNLALGSDERERCVLHVLNSDLPGDIHPENTITQKSNGQLWKVTQYHGNPADVETEYWLAKVVAGVDA